ncbi:MAG TPA: hypothetical protein VJP77_04235 [Planctomycetota bacterium]|nr:hypothetical protein [Planctomycetota bacterium]
MSAQPDTQSANVAVLSLKRTYLTNGVDIVDGTAARFEFRLGTAAEAVVYIGPPPAGGIARVGGGGFVALGDNVDVATLHVEQSSATETDGTCMMIRCNWPIALRPEQWERASQDTPDGKDELKRLIASRAPELHQFGDYAVGVLVLRFGPQVAFSRIAEEMTASCGDNALGITHFPVTHLLSRVAIRVRSGGFSDLAQDDGDLKRNALALHWLTRKPDTDPVNRFLSAWIMLEIVAQQAAPTGKQQSLRDRFAFLAREWSLPDAAADVEEVNRLAIMRNALVHEGKLEAIWNNEGLWHVSSVERIARKYLERSVFGAVDSGDQYKL